MSRLLHPFAPQALTASRILLIPAIMWLVLAGVADGLAAALFAVAAATDFLDGRLARRWGVTSPLGGFLDTTADKLLVGGALLALVVVGRASVWVAAVIIGRELAMMGLRSVLATLGVVLGPSQLGKQKALVQFVAVTVAIVGPPAGLGPLSLHDWALLVAAVVTAVSGADYFVRALPRLTSGPRTQP